MYGEGERKVEGGGRVQGGRGEGMVREGEGGGGGRREKEGVRVCLRLFVSGYLHLLVCIYF